MNVSLKQADPVAEFIERWTSSGAAERANHQPFIIELCDILGVPRPEPAKADSSQNSYVFEHPVLFDDGFGHTSTKFIDLYRRGCFILEAKQGSEKETGEDETGLKVPRRARRGTAIRGTAGWDDAMLAAKGQAELYAKALPVGDGWPPFLVIVDVGHSIELYADFTRSGKTYVAFPDALSHRLSLNDLADETIRERLKLVWTDPLELDPSRKSAKVTREVAARLAELAKSLERSGHKPERVASFLMRCLFTMFAEDVGLLPEDCFTRLLEGRRGKKLSTFPEMLESLWDKMAKGGYSPILDAKVLRFNGELFANSEALPVNEAQLELLIDASKSDWEAVEPAIFGTLLERALDPIERHKLGAHYTPRAYVERLVLPTIVEPLREQWEASKAAAVTLAKSRKLKEARAEVQDFLTKLCAVTVLDPACGSGNFLYVTLEHLKRLEGEVRDTLKGFGEKQAVIEGLGFTVDPHQLLGIELNPRAAAIAELVLWIGYLQWHFRTFGKTMPAEPIIKAFHNIECRDAVLAYDRTEPVLDDMGKPVTRWDGRTTKTHPVTGEQVPDETARVPVLRYINPRKAEWPRADYIIGNPPFIGDKTMKDALGPGYVEALRSTYKDISDSTDYVLYWWDIAAKLTRNGHAIGFGFVTTNSIRQTFNRRVLQSQLSAKPPLSLVFAIPDHPWIDEAECAAVRISMTVVRAGDSDGFLSLVVDETRCDSDEPELAFAFTLGKIFADLTVGADVASAAPLKANAKLSCPGVKLFGSGFIVTADEAKELGLGRIPGLENHIRPFRNGRDIAQIGRNAMVIDLLGITEEQVRIRFPEVYQWLYERVKPERDQNNRESYRTRWWVFGEPRATFRSALSGLSRYIVIPETSKHRFFTFLDSSILAEGSLVVEAFDDAYFLGVLSSRIHVIWALAAGGRLGVGNDPRYNKTRCFDPFPFPECTDKSKSDIRDLAEQLDRHRKARQQIYPSLWITQIYNVLEKLRSNERLSAEDKTINEQGLVSVLKQIHDDLDAAVFEAYGWPSTLTDEEILKKLVALNAERAAEEARGIIRWLRPEFQNPTGHKAATQGTLIDDVAEDPEAKGTGAKAAKTPWPKNLAEQAQAVRVALAAQRLPITAAQLARTFLRANVDRVEELLNVLASLGHARELDDGRFAAPVVGR